MLSDHYKSLSRNSTGSEFLTQCKGMEEGKYTWAVFTVLFFTAGFPASLSLLWEIFKTHRGGIPLTPNDFFILNLSIMDTLFLMFIPPGLLNHFIWMNEAFEPIWNGFYALNTCGRPLLMACSCLDCYLAVVHPIMYHKRKSLLPRAVVVGIVWTLTLATGIAYFFLRTLYFTMFPAVVFQISIVIIVTCDSLIIWTLTKSDPGRKGVHPQKQRAIQTITYSLIIAVISYLPPAFGFVIGWCVISDFQILMCFLLFPLTIASTLGSVVMPMLSLYNVGKLKCSGFACKS